MIIESSAYQTRYSAIEEVMKSTMWTTPGETRRAFIGGSDARIIMGSDDAALIRLWREKRGEVEPEDMSGNLIVQLGAATEALHPPLVQAHNRRERHGGPRRVRQFGNPRVVATLDGTVEATG